MSRLIFHVPTKIIYTTRDGAEHVFERNEELGRGSFAIVYRVTHLSTKKTYAMKVISKRQCIGLNSKKTIEKIKNEIRIQKSINHPNVVKSKYSFADESYFYFILEHCPGNNVREYCKKSPDGRLTEQETRRILKDVINGLLYIHNSEIVHYDIKLENFLIGSNGDVKIADFGLSSFRKDEKGKKFSLCGTPNYLCPEILFKESREQSCKVDIWALGVSAFIMLIGKGPFEGPTKEITFENIIEGTFYFPQIADISDEAKDFIRTTLRRSPIDRPTAEELLSHPFITKSDESPIKQMNIGFQSIQKVQKTTKKQKDSKNQNESKNQKESKNPIKNNQDSCDNNILKSPKRPSISINTKAVNACIHSPKKSHSNSPRIFANIKNNRLSPKASENINSCQNETNVDEFDKGFIVPYYFITRYCFYKDKLGYMFGDGTVGICFKDDTRVVMDPNEKFVQFYNNANSKPEVIDLDNFEEEKDACNYRESIQLVQKIARYFKKIRFSFKMDKRDYDPAIPLLNVNCYVKNEESILFKLSNNNIQVNFNDYKKLIIFWKTKKLCFFRNFREKCNLQDINEVSGMKLNSDELKKYKISKEMLLDLTITI